MLNAIHTAQLNILLVEDNEDDYLIVRDLLRDIDATHYVLEWAETYEDALTAIQAQRHDLILLDYRLAGQTGLDLLEETRGVAQRAPVILMTGQGDHDIDVHAMQAGAVDYLVKDRLDANQLERAIRYAVERQKAAEALQASEDRYRTFVENSAEGIWRFELEQPMPTSHTEDEQIAYLDRYAYVAECNEAMARLYGYEHASDVLGARFGEFLWSHEVSADNYPRRLMRNGYRLVTHETFVIDRHGQPKCVLHNMIGVVEDGLLYRLWGSQIDITERKRSENAQAQLASIVETSDDAIYSKTLDGLIVTWNKAAEALYGYTVQEVTGRPVSILIPEQWSEQTQRVQERIRRGEHVPQFETVHRHKEGRLIDVSLAVSPIIDAAGQVTGSSSIVRDITGRKRAEMRMQQSEANMAAAQRIAHFGSWEIDLNIGDDIDANPLRWSDETFRIFGYEPGSVSVTNDLFFHAIPLEEQSAIRQAISETIAQRQSRVYVHRIRRPDGEERTIRETAQFFAGEASGQPDRLVGTVHDITEQQRAEDQIRFQALLLSQVRNAAIATDLAGRVTYWNNFAETLYQWKAEEVLGKSIMDIIVLPQDQQAGEQIWREIQETGYWEGEFLVQRKDGSVFPAYAVDTLLRDAHGTATGFVGVSIDMTERKEAEKALAASEERLSLILRNVEDVVFLLQIDSPETYRFRFVNPSFLKRTGLHEEQVIGKRVQEVLPESAHAYILGKYAEAIRERRTVGWQETSQYPSGECIGEVQLTPYFDEQGRCSHLIGSVHDITERKEAEVTLRASEARFRTIIQNSSDVFHLRKPDGKIIYESPAVTRVLGYQPEEMVGHNALEFVHPDDAAQLLKTASSESEAPDGLRTLIMRVRHKDGSWRWIESFEVNLLDNPDVGAFAVNYRDITERKHAEDALRASEQRLRLTLDSGRFGTFRLDLTTGRYLEISDLSRSQFALSSEADVLLSDFFERVHPDDRAEMQAVVARASATQDVDFSSDYRIVLPDGSIRWISVHGALTYDDAGLPARMLGITQDITERKQAEEALRQQNTLIRIASHVTQTGGWSLEMPDQRVFWSDELCDILEYPHGIVPPLEEALALYPDPWQDKIIAALGACAQDGIPFDMEIKTLTRKGREIWARVCGEADRNADGVITRVQGAFQDISDRRQAEEERDRFFTLSLDMLAITSSDGYFKRLNPAFEATLGFTNAELMAKPFLEFVHPDDIIDTLAEVAKLDSGVKVMRFENRYLCRDGSYKWLQWMTAPYEDLWYCVAHDVTAIKQAAEALLAANDELEQRVLERTAQLENSNQEMSLAKDEAERANAAKSEFLSRMSHELRTPMNSILGFAQLMEMDTPVDKQAVRLGHIIKAGQHLLQLINEVLDLARVESGRLQLSSETVSLSVCIQNAADMIRPLCNRRNQRIICDWSECEPLYVQADQQRLTQVLINLLSNATKYNRDEGVILVRCDQSLEDRHRVSISDSGAGISPEQVAKLFQPFERLEADSTAIEGTGLGLALSKRLIELMGGRISVESQVGTGSTFTIELPRAAPPGQGLEALPPRLEAPVADGRQHDILYIEDNPANLELIAHILADHPQYQQRSALTGLGGLDMARKQPPALILLDLHLPDLPGDEVLARLQANPATRDIPVVVVSADATSSQIRRLLAAGAAEYLTKPLDVRLLTDVLHKLLQSPQKEDSHG